MMPASEGAQGRVEYRGEIPCRRSGLRGYTIRIVPRNEKFPLDRFETGLIHWWDGNGELATHDEKTDPAAAKVH